MEFHHQLIMCSSRFVTICCRLLDSVYSKCGLSDEHRYFWFGIPNEGSSRSCPLLNGSHCLQPAATTIKFKNIRKSAMSSKATFRNTFLAFLPLSSDKMASEFLVVREFLLVIFIFILRYAQMIFRILNSIGVA